MKPLVDAMVRWKEVQNAGQDVSLLEKRVALLEAQLGSVETSLERVLDEQEFQRRLGPPA